MDKFEKTNLSEEDKKKLRYGLHGAKLNIDFSNIYRLKDANNGAGFYGIVYKIGDSDACVKVLADDNNLVDGVIPMDRFTAKKILIKICNLKLVNVYKIIDITFSHKWKLSSMQGYVMRYYSDNRTNMLFRGYDWYKNQYEQMLKDFTLLGENCIQIADDHDKNYRVDENIVLIDCDNFILVNPLKKQQAINANISRAYGAIIMLLHDALIEYKLSKDDSFNYEVLNFNEFRNNKERFFDILKEYGNIYNYVIHLSKGKTKI